MAAGFSRPSGVALRRASHGGRGGRQAQKLRLRRSGAGHRAHRRGRRHSRRRKAGRKRRSGCAPTWTRCRSKRRPSCRTTRRFPARCMPAATTGTPRCCSARPSAWRETRDFAGNAVVIFQPAEEGGAGAMAMIDDGLIGPLRHRGSLRHAQLCRCCRSANSPSVRAP